MKDYVMKIGENFLKVSEDEEFSLTSEVKDATIFTYMSHPYIGEAIARYGTEYTMIPL